MEEIIIKISKAEDEPGYFYDIFENKEDLENADCIDGGICTTTFLNTLNMATDMVKEIIKKNKTKKHECN